MSDLIEMKPCPFCGTIPTYDEDEQVGSAVTCKVCKTDGPWAKGQESHISIERWNARQPETVAESSDLVHLQAVRDQLEIQGRDGNWNYDQYMAGMYNGLECALATLEDREPEYRKLLAPVIGYTEQQMMDAMNHADFEGFYTVEENAEYLASITPSMPFVPTEDELITVFSEEYMKRPVGNRVYHGIKAIHALLTKGRGGA